MTATAFQTIGLVLGPHDNATITDRVAAAIESGGLKTVFEAGHAGPAPDNIKESPRASSADDFGRSADLICCIGGDGTMLDAIARYHQHNKPFTGINLGHVGFLVDLPADAIDSSFVSLLGGDSIAESRMLLNVEIIRDGQVRDSEMAVNEVFFRNAQGVSMIFLDVFINEHPVHTESGDGLLISTPTGSTAYNLSSGGPILEPRVDALVLSPICPNYLNSRPVVINAQSTVEVCISSERRVRVLMGCDGQRELILDEGDIARISKHPVSWTLLHPKDYQYFSLLRSKLKWGLAPFSRSKKAKS